jgi:hypothetical protein
MGTKNNKLIEQLISNRETVSNDALSKALEAHQKKQEEAQSELLIKQLDTIQNIINGRVDQLRKIRTYEKQAKKELIQANEAFQQFKKDADFDKFKKAIGH